MREIRAIDGKLLGILNLKTYVLEIKEGRHTKRIQLSTDGTTIEYISARGTLEMVRIPSKLVWTSCGL